MAEFEGFEETVSPDFSAARVRYGQGRSAEIRQLGGAYVDARGGFELARLEGSGNIEGTGDVDLDKELNLTQIAAARKQGKISAAEAETRANVALKEATNRLPGMADEFRGRVSSFFGRGGRASSAFSLTAEEKKDAKLEMNVLEEAQRVKFRAVEEKRTEERDRKKTIIADNNLNMTVEMYDRLSPASQENMRNFSQTRRRNQLIFNANTEKLNVLKSKKDLTDFERGEQKSGLNIKVFEDFVTPLQDNLRTSFLNMKVGSKSIAEMQADGDTPEKINASISMDNAAVDQMKANYTQSLAAAKEATRTAYMQIAKANGVRLEPGEIDAEVNKINKTFTSLEELLNGVTDAKRIVVAKDFIESAHIMENPDEYNKTLAVYNQLKTDDPVFVEYLANRAKNGAEIADKSNTEYAALMQRLGSGGQDKINRLLNTTSVTETEMKDAFGAGEEPYIAKWQLMQKGAVDILNGKGISSDKGAKKLSEEISLILSPQVTDADGTVARGTKAVATDRVDRLIEIAKNGDAKQERTTLTAAKRYNQTRAKDLWSKFTEETKNFGRFDAGDFLNLAVGSAFGDTPPRTISGVNVSWDSGSDSFKVDPVFDESKHKFPTKEKIEEDRNKAVEVFNKLARPDLLKDHFFALWQLDAALGTSKEPFDKFMEKRVASLNAIINPPEEQAPTPEPKEEPKPTNEPKKLEVGIYQRDDGSVFQVTKDNELINLGNADALA